jgi:polyphosphate glucokinase
MLFLGLGTGVGSALVSERVVVPCELGRLPSGYGDTIWDRLGRKGLQRHGQEQWLDALHTITAALRRAFVTDYIMLGGGNAKKVDPLPPGTYRGGNDDAFTGGFMLWEEVVEPHDQRPGPVWRVVR